MNQQTNDNTPTPCRYQELNPEMDAFLTAYLEDGRRRGFGTVPSIFMIRSVITFYLL